MDSVARFLNRKVLVLDLNPGVLQLYPVKYSGVIKQSTWTPSKLTNVHGGKTYAEFSIGTHFPPYTKTLTAVQAPLEIFPWTPGRSLTPG